MTYYLYFSTRVIIKKADLSVVIKTSKRFQKEEDHFSLNLCKSVSLEKYYQEFSKPHGTNTLPWYGLVLYFEKEKEKVLNPFGAMSSTFLTSKKQKEELLKISDEIATFIGVPAIDNTRES